MTEAPKPVGELAVSGSENGSGALVTLKSSQRKVFGRGEILADRPEVFALDNNVNDIMITNEMTPDNTSSDATDIGLKLVGHSRSTDVPSNRGLVIDLFPFIFEASQRMSARAISRFLLEEQGVKLSAVTITRALNDPKNSWDAYFDTVEPSALVIANWWKAESLNFLFLERSKYEQIVDGRIGNPIGRLAAKLLLKGDVVSADKLLRTKWLCINKEIRLKAKLYLEGRLAVWVKPKK